MQSLLSPRDYLGADIFDDEKDAVFSPAWLYAGLRRDLLDHQDYICENVGRESVIVQNFDGELRAFSNVCAHRLSAIRSELRGNGALRCPYHGWTYDADGVARGIPHKRSFGEGELEGDRIRLRAWQVETCGELVFVRKTHEGPALAESLGELYAELSELGSALGVVISRTQYDVHANWKLWIENSVEGYHVGVVHTASIAKLVPSEDQRSRIGDHSMVSARVAESKGTQKMLERPLAARVVARDDYRHYFVFPSLCITSTRGLVFDIIRTVPVSQNATRIESTLMGTRFRDAVPAAVVDEFYRLADQSARVVQSEDQGIVEMVGRGMLDADRPGFHGSLEDRIQHFQAAWRRRMP